MKFRRLVKESNLFWPSEIIISDGKLHDSGGGYFPALSEVCRKAEDTQQGSNDWHNLMCWAIFCGFHRLACKKFKVNDLSFIKYCDIDFQYVEQKLIESLMGTYPSWPKYMRSQYENGKTHNKFIKDRPR
jgi:hypothetical protein